MEEKDITSARTKLMWISSTLLLIAIGWWNIKELNLLWMLSIEKVELYGFKYWIILIAISAYLLMRYKQFLKEGKKEWKYWEQFLMHYLLDAANWKKIITDLTFSQEKNWEYETEFQIKDVRVWKHVLKMENGIYLTLWWKWESPFSILIDRDSIECSVNRLDWIDVNFSYKEHSLSPKLQIEDDQTIRLGYMLIELIKPLDKIVFLMRKISYQYGNKTIWDQDFPIYLNKFATTLFVTMMVIHHLTT